MAPSLRLGRYALLRRVGRGAMGEVWAGRPERESATRVAVKVLRQGLREDKVHREVAAAAALDHENIVRILDHGRVAEADAAQSLGLLEADAPYLVLEWVPDGTLHERPPPQDWLEARGVLLGLLAGLAHAHSRGVVHRDIKPGNVLMDGDTPKLADFGLARRIDHAASPHSEGFAVGTPGFMAPEQIRARTRDIGPPTDLYAVGVLAYRLVSGRMPHPREDTIAETLAAQLNRRPAPLRSLFDVPAALEAWILTAMAADPAQRFAWAADAAEALRGLGPALPRPLPPSAEPLDDEPDTLLEQLGADEATLAVDRVTGPRFSAVPAPRISAPALPEDWRRPTPPPRTPPGPSLFGLRRVPLAGRERERDLLWAEARRVVATRQVGCVVLRGSEGLGKSRLAAWIGERAQEVGGALLVHAEHGPIGSPEHGLGAMTARALGCVGLGREDVRERLLDLRAAASDADRRALVDIVQPAVAGADDVATHTLVTNAHRHAVIGRTLRHRAGRRLVVVRLEDVQHSLASLSFMDHLVAAADGPTLVVATVGTDEPLPPATERALAAVAESALVVDLGPLDDATHRTLVEQLAPLSPELAHHVETRTAGSPLYAVQLLGSWLDHGALEPAVDGLRLTSGSPPEPTSLAGAWEDRLSRVLVDASTPAEAGLELAAVLGREVDWERWTRACELADVVSDRRLVTRLADAGLARWWPEGRGWSFVHGLLREAVLARAVRGDRLARHHAVCAAILDGVTTTELQHARAVHCIHARDPDRALDLCLEALDTVRLVGDDERLERLCLDTAERALADAAPGPDDRRRFRYLLRAIEAYLLAGDHERAEDGLMRLDEAVAVGPPWGRAYGMLGRANIAMRRGSLQAARDDLVDAEPVLEQAEDWAGLDRCLAMRTYCALRLGRWRAGEESVKRRLANAPRVGGPALEFSARGSLVGALRGQGRIDEALAVGRRVVEAHRRAGRPGPEARVSNELGDAEREAGRLDEAEALYRRAVLLFEQTGYTGLMVARWNLGLLRILAADYAEARRLLLDCLAWAERRQARSLEGGLLVHLACCDAGEGDADGWDSRMTRGTELVLDTGFAEPDIPRFAERAADLASDRGWPARAVGAFRFAAARWEVAGRPEDAARVRAKLAALDQKG